MEATRRNATFDTEAGPRVALGALFASFTPRERCRWFQYAGNCEMDEFGILPSGVETFLATLEVKRQAELF